MFERPSHSEIFLNGLTACGLDRSKIIASLPLSTTDSLLNYLFELAVNDTLCYTAAYGIMHSPQGCPSARTINEQFRCLSNKYQFAFPIFEAFREHALLDISLGHDNLVLQRICSQYGVFPVETRLNCLRVAMDVVGKFISFFNGIQSHYGQLHRN